MYELTKRSSSFQSVGSDPGGSGSLTTNAPVFPRRQLVATLVDDPNVPTWHGDRRRPVLDGKLFDSYAIRTDCPAGFGLPPMIDHRYAELVFRPLQGVGVGPLASQEQRAQRARVVVTEQLAVRVFLLNRTKCGRRSKEAVHAMVFDDSPERARIGRSNGLALVQDRRVSVQKGP